MSFFFGRELVLLNTEGCASRRLGPGFTPCFLPPKRLVAPSIARLLLLGEMPSWAALLKRITGAFFFARSLTGCE